MKALGLVGMILIAAGDSVPPGFDSQRLVLAATRMNNQGEVLRVKHDTVRNRKWVLGLEYVDVYDSQSNGLIRRIELPRWTVAGFVCPPDIAFDRAGTAYVSHNVEPRLWQIDSDSFQLKEHSLRLLQHEHLDIGLGRLRFTDDGALLAVASLGGTRWRIDLVSATAQLVDIEAPVMDECAWQ